MDYVDGRRAGGVMWDWCAGLTRCNRLGETTAAWEGSSARGVHKNGQNDKDDAAC